MTDIIPEVIYVGPDSLLMVPKYTGFDLGVIKKLIKDDINTGEWNIKALEAILNGN